jgi:hypothetical protein
MRNLATQGLSSAPNGCEIGVGFIGRVRNLFTWISNNPGSLIQSIDTISMTSETE